MFFTPQASPRFQNYFKKDDCEVVNSPKRYRLPQTAIKMASKFNNAAQSIHALDRNLRPRTQSIVSPVSNRHRAHIRPVSNGQWSRTTATRTNVNSIELNTDQNDNLFKLERNAKFARQEQEITIND